MKKRVLEGYSIKRIHVLSNVEAGNASFAKVKATWLHSESDVFGFSWSGAIHSIGR